MAPYVPPMPADSWRSDGQALVNYLPHVFEVLHTGPVGTSRSAAVGFRNNRRAKRRGGVFYTPTDVVQLMLRETVGRLVDRTENPTTILDPCCGSGVFLAEALSYLEGAQGRPLHVDERLAIVEQNLFGIDLDESAVLCTSFALAARVLKGSESSPISPLECVTTIRRNLSCSDALTVADLSLQTNVFDRPAFGPEGGFDVIIANPPYSAAHNGSVDRALYLEFLPMMWRGVGASAKRSAMVVPLSLCYHGGQRFRTMRREMARQPGSFCVAAYDRAPDSLFGDDVKTRAAIVVYHREPSGPQLSTTPLQRWSAPNRADLLSSLSCCPSSWAQRDAAIPKIGSQIELRAFTQLSEAYGSFGESVDVVDLSSDADPELEILIGSTGYNWLPVFRRLEGDERATARSGLKALRFPSAPHADTAYAILSSCLAYWWWRVLGDGFHVTLRWVRSLPVGLPSPLSSQLRSIGDSGRNLWEAVRERRVPSVNRGRRSFSIDPHQAPQLRMVIDEQLEDYLALPKGFAEFSHDYLSSTIAAGRTR